MADGFARLNPFAKRESHSDGAINTYRILTIISWLMAVVASVYYSTWQTRSHDGTLIRQGIWDLNRLYPSAFTLNATIVEIFWVVIFLSQIGYVGALFSNNAETKHSAANVGSHFILNNLLQFAFVLLFVHNHFILAEIVLVVNFFNLTSQYFRHNSYARYIHMPVVSAPLAWTFVAIYWNGAIMVHRPHNLVARIFGNVFVWAILVYGLFYIFAYKDYTMGFSLSVLSAALGVAQFVDRIAAFQWIFAFVIMSVLFVMTLVVAVPAWQGRDFNWGRSPQADAERAPLLNDN
jgi:hypothetical protein